MTRKRLLTFLLVIGCGVWLGSVAPVLAHHILVTTYGGALVSGDTIGATREMHIDVSYRVFAPGTYPAPAPGTPFITYDPIHGVPGYDPTLYTYAYQIENISDGVGKPDTATSLATIGVINPLTTSAGFDPTLDPLLHILPGAPFPFLASSMAWPITLPATIAAGSFFSEILLMQSANPPVPGNISVLDSGLSVTLGVLVPSPVAVPLPAAVWGGMALIGMIATPKFRRLRDRSALAL